VTLRNPSERSEPVFRSKPKKRAKREEKMEELPREQQREPIHREKGDIAYFSKMSFICEDIRVSCQVRLKHLKKLGKESPDTEHLLALAWPLEQFADGRLAEMVLNHPVWPWAKRVKGIGQENLPKVLGLIEGFGHHYPTGDQSIPPHCLYRPIEPYMELDKTTGQPVEKEGIWVEGIERLTLPSKLWKYSGMAVKDGVAVKREAGTKLEYNSQLRMAFFRLATSLMRGQGIWYTGGEPTLGFSRGYEGHREVLTARKNQQGYRIIPTPKKRICPKHGPVEKKAAKYCPICGTKLSLKAEGPGVIYQGHLHLMALRLMLKDFQLCLWRVWREALGLPTPDSYGEARLQEPRIDPWKMVDR